MDDVEVEEYFDPNHPGSFAGVDKFYRHQTGLTRKNAAKWLSGQEAYTLHRPVRYRFPRNKVVVSGMDAQWDADLMVMSAYKEVNDDFVYVLVTVDILSHYACTRALKTKTPKEVSRAFREIFAEGRRPLAIRTDRGREFTGAVTKKMMKEENVHHFVTSNEVKANYAERLIRTLKLRISRYMTHKETHRWIDVLASITSSYNKTYHRTIKRPPASVDRDNEAEVWTIQYDTPRIRRPDGDYKLSIGDHVRISHLRRTFQREYDERYTGEVFKVTGRTTVAGRNLYTLEDLMDEEVEGKFYQIELQKVTVDPAGVFKIEKVIKTRKPRGREKEFLVRWKYYPPKFDSWIKASDMQDV